MITFKVGDRVKLPGLGLGASDYQTGCGTVLSVTPTDTRVRWDGGCGSGPDGMNYPLRALIPLPKKEDPRAAALDRHVAPHIYERDTNSLQAEAEYLELGKPVLTNIDTLTNQLLNGLYHDRARLEKIVKNAVELIASMKGLYLSDDAGGKSCDRIAGKLQQFVTDNG